MRLFLFEVDFHGTVERYVHDSVPLRAGGHSWQAGSILRHDIPGRQQPGFDKDNFNVVFLDDKLRTVRRLFLPKYLRVGLKVYETIKSGSGYGTPVLKYAGTSASLASLKTNKGLELRALFRGRAASPGAAYQYVLIDEFQREGNSSDDFLAYAEQAQTGTWSGVLR